MTTKKLEDWIEDMIRYLKDNVSSAVAAYGPNADVRYYLENNAKFARHFWNKYDYYCSVDPSTRAEVERAVFLKWLETYSHQYASMSTDEKEKIKEMIQEETAVADKKIDDWVDAIVAFLKTNLKDEVYIHTLPAMERSIEWFWIRHDPHYHVSLSKRGEINWKVRCMWPEIFPEQYSMFSPEEKEGLKELLRKTAREFTDEIIDFFKEKRNWPALFDRSTQGRRKHVLQKFWAERYPHLDRVLEINYTIRNDAFFMIFSMLPTVEKQVYEDILDSLLKWADENDKDASFLALRQFLKKEGLEDAPSRFQKELLADFKNELKSRDR